MKNRKNNLFKRIFAIAFIFSIIGALLKINHVDNSQPFLILGLIATFVYISVGIYEVNTSTKISRSAKIIWTIGFIVLNFLVGIYYFMNRDKFIDNR